MVLNKHQIAEQRAKYESLFKAAVMERDRQARLIDLYDGAVQACDELIKMTDSMQDEPKAE